MPTISAWPGRVDVVFSWQSPQLKEKHKTLAEGLVWFIITSALIYAPAFYDCSLSLFLGLIYRGPLALRASADEGAFAVAARGPGI